MKNSFIDQLNSPMFTDILESSPGIMGVFNYDTFQYEYFSKNVKSIFGYASEDYINGGLGFSYSTLNSIHANIIASNIFPLFLEYCVKYAPNDGLKKLRFSYEYLVNCKSGKSRWCLHQFTIMEVDHKGYPILDLFSITDMNETKKDDLINFVISQKTEEGEYETIYSIAYQTRDLSLLSSREMQVLKLLCEGNSTPKIAGILHLSEHTVKSHRKNILQKLEVKNTMDIIKIAYDKGLL